MSTMPRRHFLQAAAALGGAGILQACGTSNTPIPPPQGSRSSAGFHSSPAQKDAMLRIIACSGYAERSDRIDLGIQRLMQAGFAPTNTQAAYRRYQRFAGHDSERIADVQDVASGRVPTPKVLMGLRGGYGAARLLPHVDWASLGSRMREHGTLFFGFSDVCALQLALLARGNMPSFAGPMVYSEFGKYSPSAYTMQMFIDGSTRPNHSIQVHAIQNHTPQRMEGVLWGGNLSVITSLAGSPYLPDINGGILFLEDVSEQPYRIERMLQTLYLAGVLGKQQAVILGDFRMGTIRDVYDSSYTLASVAATMSRVAKVPVLTGFPFGHITNKATFPLGAHARIEPNSNGGYSVQFSQYPTLDAGKLALHTLMPSFSTEPSPDERGDLE
ncbi:muramoyltetrapeptide carboxypeptidase [Neisseria sp. HSC-16F19]|nr:LD-carboxypeptidase [Neisseria sp. HSC-16F19]MCP2041079.1 muramoyltetrapeptide carboxypeptidase [Neisseria sp. HSC-16F19]